MPQNAFFLRTRDLLVIQKTTQRPFFSTLHPLSTVIFATATELAFVLLCNSRFSFRCYTQREATPTQKSARKCAATSRDFLREITKRIHSSKPASPNRPIGPCSRPRDDRPEYVSPTSGDIKPHIINHVVSELRSCLSRGTAVRICFGSPFSSRIVVCGHCLVTLSLTVMKH